MKFTSYIIDLFAESKYLRSGGYTRSENNV